MAETLSWYGKALQFAFNKQIDWDSDSIYAMFLTADYTPDLDAHDYEADISAYEVANGNGYVTGGFAVSGRSLSYDAANHRVVLDASDVAVTGPCTFDFRYIVLVDRASGAAATNPLFLLYDAGQTVSAFNAPSITLPWDDDGVAVVNRSAS